MAMHANQIEMGLHRLLKYAHIKHLSRLALETQDVLYLEDFEREGFAMIKEAVDNGLHKRLQSHGILGSTVTIDRGAPVAYSERGPLHSNVSEVGFCGAYTGMVLRAETFSESASGFYPQITHVIESPEGFQVPGLHVRPAQAFIPVTHQEVKFLN